MPMATWPLGATHGPYQIWGCIGTANCNINSNFPPDFLLKCRDNGEFPLEKGDFLLKDGRLLLQFEASVMCCVTLSLRCAGTMCFVANSLISNNAVVQVRFNAVFILFQSCFTLFLC